MQRNKASQRLIAIVLTVGVHAVIFAAFYFFAIQKPIDTPKTEFTAILLEPPPPAENPSIQDSPTTAPPILPELSEFKKPVVTTSPKTPTLPPKSTHTESAKESAPQIVTSPEKKQSTSEITTSKPAPSKPAVVKTPIPHATEASKTTISKPLPPKTSAETTTTSTPRATPTRTSAQVPTAANSTAAQSKPQIAPKSIEKDEFEALKKELKQKEDIRKGLEAEIATTNVTRVASTNKSETKPTNPAVEADIKQAAEAAAREAEIKKYYDESITRIKKKVRQKWEVPAGPKFTAMARITLSPTGDVLSIVITKTSGNTAFDESLKSAIHDASPLPITYDPEVYKRLRIASYTFTSP